MRTTIMLTMLAGLIVVISVGQEVEIQSLDSFGEITWTAPSNSDCTIEWASSLTPTANWQQSWITLKDIPCTNNTSGASVPMYYRVICQTNGLFVRMPVGRTYVYLASNTVGQVWTQELFCAGILSIPTSRKNYVLLQITNIYEGTPPLGSRENESGFWRSTDQGAYIFNFTQEDSLEWQDSAVGTMWTNTSQDEPPESIFKMIETNETVVVEAGTFHECIRFLQTMTNQSPPHTQWRQWVKSGHFMVKWVDIYSAEDSEAFPVTYELQSWHD